MPDTNAEHINRPPKDEFEHLDERYRPRAHLFKFLEGETEGSPKIRATSDNMELRIVNNKISYKTEKYKEGLKESKPESELLHIIESGLLEDIIERRMIWETIRKRKSGPQAHQYTNAFEEAGKVYHTYFKVVKKLSYPDRDTLSVKEESEVELSAASELLRHLESQNSERSNPSYTE